MAVVLQRPVETALFVSLAFGQHARAAGIAQSMGSRGDCYDNAVAESFFATLKKELIHRRTWPTKDQLRLEVFDYIEVFYNRQRRHSTLGQGNSILLYEPMMTALTDTLAACGITAIPGLALADAGYWSEANATAPGPDRLIATMKDHKQRRAARDLGQTSGPPPTGAAPADAMEHRLRTAEGAAAYAQPSCTIEPVFADRKQNRGMRGFRRRGLEAAKSEWALMHRPC